MQPDRLAEPRPAFWLQQVGEPTPSCNQIGARTAPTRADCPAMDAARHLELIRLEGARLAATPVDALDAPVPSVEGWTAEGVIRHTGKVHRWVTGMLAAGLDTEPGRTESLPKGPDCLPAYREALDAMVDELSRHDADEVVQTFIGPQPAAFWFRRQAAELAVHRVDAADAVHAAGGAPPAPHEVDGAADGVDEWARFFLAVRWPMRYGSLPDDLVGRSVHLHGTDDPAPADGSEWHLTFTAEGTEVEAAHLKGDVALRGSASDLLLVLWRRRPLSTLDAFGDEALAARLLDVARF